MQNLKRRYDRFFIMFKTEQSGYSIDKQEIKGYMKVEIKDGKGKIITYVQGLKNLKNNEIYKTYLISSENDSCTGIPMKQLEIDDRGHGESIYEFNPDNVEDSGLSIEKFNVGAILVKTQNSSEIIAPVVGYKGKEVLWKNNFKEFLLPKSKLDEKKDNQKDDNVSEDAKNHLIDEKMQKLPISSQETINSVEILNDKDNFIDKQSYFELETETPNQIFNKMVNKFYSEMEELQKYKVLSEEDKQRLILKNKECEIVSDLQYMFEHNPKIKPFKNTYNDVNWITIQPYELAVLPIQLEKYIWSSFINYSYKKYKHLILGQYNNKDGYLLGVKDVYYLQNVQITSFLGFEKFINCESKDLSEGNEGYWILEIS